MFELMELFFYLIMEIGIFDDSWELETRYLEESIETFSHALECLDALSDNLRIADVSIPEKLEVARYDSKWSLELMSSIVDKVMHSIYVLTDRFERLTDKISPHEVEGNKYEDVEHEKTENISQNILEWISSTTDIELVSSSIRLRNFVIEEALIVDDTSCGEAFEKIRFQYFLHFFILEEWIFFFADDNTRITDRYLGNSWKYRRLSFSVIFMISSMPFYLSYFSLEHFFSESVLKKDATSNKKSLKNKKKKKCSSHKKSDESSFRCEE